MNRMINGEGAPSFQAAPFPQGITYQSMYQPDPAYPFLHDTALGMWQGRIICAWYNCTQGEIRGDTIIRGRWSADGGKTWTDQEIIAASPDESVHYVPVSFTDDGKDFYAFVTRMCGHDQPTGYEIFRYTGSGWESVALREDRMLINTPAYRMDDGHYLMAGRVCFSGYPHPEIPNVAVSETSDVLSPYRMIEFDGPWRQENFTLRYPETAVIIDGRDITAFVRGEGFTRRPQERPYRFTSDDYGRTWSQGELTDLPCIGSKLFGGILSNGLSYLVFSAENDRNNNRSLLALAVSRRGEDHISRRYRLLDGPHEATGLIPEWSYPCSMEYDGKLYIACTSHKSGAILMTIPLASLEA